MSYTHERDSFIARTSRDGMPVDVARRLLSLATTLQRLAEAQCNGDWPYDNGQRETVPCPVCEAGTVPSQLLGPDKSCPDCRATARAKSTIPAAFEMMTQGDPRGYVLRIRLNPPVVTGGRKLPPSDQSTDWIGVPTR